MATKRLYIFDSAGNDISDEVELVNGRANTFGWSTADLQYKGEVIGSHYCGAITLKEPYTYRVDDL